MGISRNCAEIFSIRDMRIIISALIKLSATTAVGWVRSYEKTNTRTSPLLGGSNLTDFYGLHTDIISLDDVLMCPGKDALTLAVYIIAFLFWIGGGLGLELDFWTTARVSAGEVFPRRLTSERKKIKLSSINIKTKFLFINHPAAVSH